MAFVRSVDTRKLCCEGDKWQLLPFLLDATLNSGRNRAKKCANETTDWYMTPQLPKPVTIKGRTSSSKQKPDVYFRTLVVVLPAASVFYCPFLCHEESGRLMQGPISWLRLHRRDGDAAKNSFIQTIHSAWQIAALLQSNGIPRATPVLKAGYHLHDKDPAAPLIVPDQYDDSSCQPGIFVRGEEQIKNWYQNAFRKLFSCKVGCRYYLPGCKHRSLNIHPGDAHPCLVVDPFEEGACDLRVAIYDKDKKVVTDSVVCVRDAFARHRHFIEELTTFGELIVQRTRKGNCRGTSNDDGQMYVLGDVRDRTSTTTRTRVSALTRKYRHFLPTICKKVRRVSDELFPGATNAMLDKASDAGVEISPSLGGMDGMSPTVVVSTDLANAPHLDTSDESHSVVYWTESVPGGTDGWYLLFPNILVKRSDKKNCSKTHHGLAIRLFHGAAVAWDGRVLRHCTTKFEKKILGNTQFGFWFGINRFSVEEQSLPSTI